VGGVGIDWDKRGIKVIFYFFFLLTIELKLMSLS
jgi:hypothetical protein